MVNNPQADPQSFIDAFRQALSCRDTIEKRELARLLHEYARLCEEANRRLHECHVLVQRGQYANAVALAEQEPSLLAHCGLLELAERDSLAGIAQELGIKAPPPLNYDLAEIVQIAYDKCGTVTGNLKRLHTLTLARAPLPTRLAVMRQLLIQNPNHPYMDADIRAFETCWFRQAPDFAFTWLKKRRPDVIAEMLHDLAESGYVETPPVALVAALEGLLAKARDAALPKLAEQIRDQFQRQSLVALRPLVQQWHESVAGPGGAEAAARHGVTAALAWVQQALDADAARSQRQRARSRLLSLLDQEGTTRSDLQSAYDSLHKLRAVDADIQRKYRRRLAEFGRRRLLVLATCVVGLLATGGALSYAWQRASAMANQSGLVDALLAEVSPLVAAGQYDQALEKMDAAPRSVTSDPRVAAVQHLATQQNAQAKAFDAAWREIQAGPADDRMQPLLDKARQLAHSDEARRRVAGFEQQWHQKQAATDERQKAEFARRLAMLLAAAEQLLETTRGGRASSTSAAALRDVSDRLAELREQARRLHWDERPLDEIQACLVKVENWGKVSEALAQFRTELAGAPGDARTLERIALWLNGTLAPMSPDVALAEQAKNALLSLTNWKSAAQLRDALQSAEPVSAAVQDAWKDQPPADVLRTASQYAEMYRQRNPRIDGTAAAALRKYVDRPDIVGLWGFRRIGKPEEFYTRTEPKPAGAQRIEILQNSSGETKTELFSGVLITRRAPQSVFAERIAPWLQESQTAAAWHAALARHYDALLDAEEMDALLRFRLLQKTLSLVLGGSVGYRQLVGSRVEVKALTDPRSLLLEGDWLQNKSPELRSRAARAIQSAPRLDQLAAPAAESDERLLTQIKRGLLVVGWLSREEGKVGLVPFVGPDPEPGSRLYTVIRETWNEVGVVEPAGAKLNSQADQYLGWPVFAVSKFTSSSP